jgi:hypothetical protein
LSLSMLIVLMYMVSLSIRPSFKLDIHNQCLNIDLVSQTYFISDDLECHKPPDYKTYAGDTMRSGFVIKSDGVSRSVLMYILQRKQTHEFTEDNEDVSSVAHLLVIWGIFEFMQLYADVLVVEYDKGFDWDKDNLKELHFKNINRFRFFPYSATDTWPLNNNTALMTTFEIMNEDLLLDIKVRELERYNCVKMPVHIDLKR